MSWMQNLYETYQVAERMDLPYESRPVPPSHMMMPTHVEIVLDGQGNFRRATAEQKFVWIPVTEDSSCRSRNMAPHPLCDKLQYVAGDAMKYGFEKSYFDDVGKDEGYFTLLSSWSQEFKNPKIHSVVEYVSKRSLINDLVLSKVLYVDDNNHFIKTWAQKSTKPKIFDVLSSNQGQEDVMVRWCVEIPGDPETQLWMDESIVNSWVAIAEKRAKSKSFCIISAKDNVPIATKHPYGIRRIGASDKAKLISSNDTQNFTFRGRFMNAEEACSISYDLTWKAHSALRWLITARKQAFDNSGQVYVAWESLGKKLPAFLNSTNNAFGDDDVDYFIGDLGQSYAWKLKKKIAGYKEKLGSRSNIFVIGVDSADDNKGRLSIIFYRELQGSELLERLEKWHLRYAWYQNYSKDLKFTGAPSPKDIAIAAFGRRIDAKLSKLTVSRILPCIVDDVQMPRDLVRLVVNNAVNRISMQPWDWEKTLGIACGLYRGTHEKGDYKMALEEDRNTRDYLYGRLLAVADKMEQIALSAVGEKRDTNAARYMHRFSRRPYSTWCQIEDRLGPYRSRLRAVRGPFFVKMEKLCDEIHSKFLPGDYERDTPLSGEFLLGFHCQRHFLSSNNNDVQNAPKEKEE